MASEEYISTIGIKDIYNFVLKYGYRIDTLVFHDKLEFIIFITQPYDSYSYCPKYYIRS